MKLFTASMVTAAILVLAKCQEEDIMNIKKQAIAECTIEHKISKEAVEGIVNHQNVSSDREVKCWLGCVFKKLGMIKEGKLDWERCKMITKHCLTNDEDKAKVDKIAEICQAEVPKDEKDECKLAYAATVCKINNWKQFGLPIGDGKE
nr:odorant binding protein 16 [Graphosoma rubrolineatum]